MPSSINRVALLGGLAVCLLSPSVYGGSRNKEPVLFERDVAPVLRARCWSCHGDKKQKAGLDLRSMAAMVQGGESGPVLKPGSLNDSLLWEKLASDKMPPGQEKLSPREKQTVKRWIESGARGDDRLIAKTPSDAGDRQVTDADRDFWAFRPPARPAVPTPRQRGRVRNPIDAFILAALEKTGLTLSAEADRLTVLRRATFDLTGLPPTPGEIAAFLADESETAFEKVVDRLLASQRYGERWGRHWLDLAGYADSEGILDADYVRTAAWRYRDYVIRAFNSDKPYDRFLQEQLAGDELTDYWTAHETKKELGPQVVDGLIATGYLRCASDTSRPDFVTIKNAPGYYFQTLDDTVKIVASSTMGLTVHCAKCHSHKYDPIPQTDYYRLQAIFMSGYRPAQWIPQVQRHLFEATTAQEKEAKTHNAKIDAAIASLKKQMQDQQTVFAERLFQERLAQVPAVIREDVRVALTLPSAKRNEVQKYLAEKFQASLRPAAPALEKALTDVFAAYRTKGQALNQAVLAQEKLRQSLPEIRAFYDLPGEAKTHLLRRGDYLKPGPEVAPGTLAVLATRQPFQWGPPPKSAKTSGRRLAFARWLTQPGHPLTARVLVNRLWLHHFGQGIVATPDNFGRTGAMPSHPELLDWLATEFTAQGWSIKKLHRLIMTSTTYRQISRIDPMAHVAAKKLDPDNLLLWRQRLRRLEAEALRDAVLAVAGDLNPQMFGPPVPMQRQGNARRLEVGEIVVAADASGNRRSIYLQVRRSQPLTFLQLFDQPVIETNCTRRETSTVASQALTLLNSDFMIRQAEMFAERVLKENPGSPGAHALLLAFGRRATDQESAKLDQFAESQTVRHTQFLAGNPAPGGNTARRRALADLCHMLLSSNEFAYVD